jgi:glycosyltransferase involved in cell wall biosynthesis
MRVLHAIAGRAEGGAEAFFERLAAALARRGLTQQAAIREFPGRRDRLRAAGIEVVELGFGGALDLATRFALKRRIAAFRPDIVLSWMSRATRHTPRPTARLPFAHVARLGGYYDMKHYRACEALIANTEDIAEHCRRGGIADARVHVIPNFVAEQLAEPLARAELAPAGAPLLLCLGRLHPNKAFEVAIGALAEIPGAVLAIAGAGEERGKLEAQAVRLGLADRVRFLGWREDAARLIRTADFVLVPSRREPLGNVVLEGWAQGTPVIAAASLGPAALIRHGENGLLVPVEDAASLAAEITRAAGDNALRTRLIEGGRRTLLAEFSEPAIVARYLDLFERMRRQCAA